MTRRDPPPAVVTVGLDASPPFPLQSGHPGEGFEVDLLRAVADRVGVELRYQSALWSSLVERLLDGRVDMICSAATITAERKRAVDFSAPYLEFELAVVVRAEAHPDPVSGELDGLAVGVRAATTAEQHVRAARAPRLVRTYDFNTDAYAALASGEVDAVVDDHLIARGFASSTPGLRVATTLDGTTSGYGIMFAKGRDALREAVDDALDRLRRDGTRDRLVRTWFIDGAPQNSV